MKISKLLPICVFLISFIIICSSSYSIELTYNSSCPFDSPGIYLSHKFNFYSYNYELDKGDGIMGKRGLVEDTNVVFDYELNVSGNWSDVYENVFLSFYVRCDGTTIHEDEIRAQYWKESDIDYKNTSILKFHTYFNITKVRAGCSFGGNFYGINPEKNCNKAHISGLGLSISPLTDYKVYSKEEYLLEKEILVQKEIHGGSIESPKKKVDYLWIIILLIIVILILLVCCKFINKDKDDLKVEVVSLSVIVGLVMASLTLFIDYYKLITSIAILIWIIFLIGYSKLYKRESKQNEIKTPKKLQNT